MPSPDLQKLIADYRSGYALASAFYTSKEIYQRDLEAVFFSHWVTVGHISQLPDAGCYFVYEFGGESVIITRDREDSIRAFANVCRHRGSKICAGAGKVSSFVCPYHAWTYNLDGTLRGARMMPKDFVAGDYQLKNIRCEVFHGLIFINLDEAAPPVTDIVGALDESLAIYDLANTKIARRETYCVNANWKLAVENFMECYHCTPAHREYAACHTMPVPQDNAALHPAMLKRAKEIGYRTAAINATPTDDAGMQCYYARAALYEPHVTGSQDGKPVSKLLGAIKEFGGGIADVQFGAVSFGLLYADYAVLYGFSPRAVQATDLEVTWLVRADAQAGKDYDLEKLTWLWRVTTDADKKIIADNQVGVNSRFYEPGPLSEMETFTGGFIEWYLGKVGAG